MGGIGRFLTSRATLLASSPLLGTRWPIAPRPTAVSSPLDDKGNEDKRREKDRRKDEEHEGNIEENDREQEIDEKESR